MSAKIKASELLKQLAEDNDWRFGNNYSGRGMFGKTCLSITSEDRSPVKIIEQAAQLGITGASWDNMGLGTVVYWPRLNSESEVDHVELRDIDEE